MHQFVWGADDTLLWVAAYYWADSGWPTTVEFMAAIVDANYPKVIDWQSVPVGIVIALPFRV